MFLAFFPGQAFLLCLAFWPWRSLPVNFFSFLAHMGMFFCFFSFLPRLGFFFHQVDFRS